MIAIFLGAGFSALGNVPLASQLFDLRPHVDTVFREDLIRHVPFLPEIEYLTRNNKKVPRDDEKLLGTNVRI